MNKLSKGCYMFNVFKSNIILNCKKSMSHTHVLTLAFQPSHSCKLVYTLA